MDLAEKHMRLRAHDDEAARIAFHQFVTEHFGGEYQRAVWFADECRSMAEAVRDTPTFYSRKGEFLGFVSGPRGN